MNYFEDNEKEELDKKIIDSYQTFVGFLTKLDMDYYDEAIDKDGLKVIREIIAKIDKNLSSLEKELDKYFTNWP
jgi:uncharacterized protein (DUF2164 family)